MASFPVSPKKASALAARMHAVGCAEKQIEETLLKGGGVVLLHQPTGLRIRCCQQRSQGLNRFLARRTLVEELEARQQQKTRHEVKAEQRRRQKGRPERRTVDAQMGQYQLRPVDTKAAPADGQPTPPSPLQKLLGQLRALQD